VSNRLVGTNSTFNPYTCLCSTIGYSLLTVGVLFVGVLLSVGFIKFALMSRPSMVGIPATQSYRTTPAVELSIDCLVVILNSLQLILLSMLRLLLHVPLLRSICRLPFAVFFLAKLCHSCRPSSGRPVNSLVAACTSLAIAALTSQSIYLKSLLVVNFFLWRTNDLSLC
jgi:hypothetical protein